MWIQRKDCATCGEVKRFHNQRGQCRFQQAGWISVEDRQPDLKVKVLARRNKEVFVAMRKVDVMAISSDDRMMWVTPYKRDGETVHGIVEGITHWRELRPTDTRMEKSGRMTAAHHAK